MSFLFNQPDPPNPFATAAASTGTNVATGVANAFLGNVNQVTPQGNLNYDVSGNYSWQDPTTGQTYNIPRFTATQSLSSTQGATQGEADWARYNTAALGHEQASRLRQQFANPLNIAGAPAFGDTNSLRYAPWAQSWIGDAGSAAQTFGNVDPIQQRYGDFAGERNRIEAGLMDRLNPSLGIERNRYEQQLADQGIRYGSPAYTNAMDNYNRMSTDARLGVIGQAGSEQQRLASIAQQQGEFYNRAQQQAYEQALGRGQFYNTGQQQQFGQNALRAQQTNAALAQNFQQAQSTFNASNAARQQYLNEQFALRNQPINELSALLAGGQVSQPNFLTTNMPTIPTTDVAGLINRNFDQQMAVNTQQSANANQLIGGMFGLAGGLARSDRDVKHDLHRMGSVLAENQQGDERSLPIYQYKYKDDPEQQPRVGPMAQDVEKIDKRAVRKIGGTRYIDVPKLGSILKAA